MNNWKLINYLKSDINILNCLQSVFQQNCAIAFILNLQLNSEGNHVFVTTLDTKNYHFYQGFRTHQMY
ncbi:hypothetical protein [Fischerella sp. PCC 9605]|uniref:hypothetical protein n=1 Tax=Fischerella sp. PCC 9605 TaxID=1173024 RepID=UPI001E5300D5|nr:hypothetical protein [Fischerella sp. PCC 9605]